METNFNYNSPQWAHLFCCFSEGSGLGLLAGPPHPGDPPALQFCPRRLLGPEHTRDSPPQRKKGRKPPPNPTPPLPPHTTFVAEPFSTGPRAP